MPCLAFFLSPGCGPVIIGTANMLIADVWLLNRVSGLDKALYGGEGVRHTVLYRPLIPCRSAEIL
jgi:hypothetical protein